MSTFSMEFYRDFDIKNSYGGAYELLNSVRSLDFTYISECVHTLYDDGLSTSEVGEKIGRSYVFVGKLLKKMGVDLGPVGGKREGNGFIQVFDEEQYEYMRFAAQENKMTVRAMVERFGGLIRLW